MDCRVCTCYVRCERTERRQMTWRWRRMDALESKPSEKGMSSFGRQLDRVVDHIRERHAAAETAEVTASGASLAAANAFLDTHATLPEAGLGTAAVVDALLYTVGPGLVVHQSGPRYFGFVTGGTTDPALLADLLVASYDQNVQVHLPHVSVATRLEVLALDMVADLIGFDARSVFTGKTITTGATSANVLGLCVGREYVGRRLYGPKFSVADEGVANVKVAVLHASGHACVAKAAAIVGIGRKNCYDLAATPNSPNFNLENLESTLIDLQSRNVGGIIVLSNGEVNSGHHTSHIPEIRALADKYGAWLHMDAAFGAFAPPNSDNSNDQYRLADSITSDAHKWLNVPYDAGLFFTKRRDLLLATCSPTFDLAGSGPAYLSSTSSAVAVSPSLQDVTSPLMTGIENSRRFRALPLYASLLALGREGYRSLFARNVAFANRVARWIHASGDYILLNSLDSTVVKQEEDEVDGVQVSSVVLFAAKKGNRGGFDVSGPNVHGNAQLVERINGSRMMYVTGTTWNGKGAIRLAVSNWRTGLHVQTGDETDTDFETVVKVLAGVMAGGT
ncbi:pyridoxal phosphate-dependent transferase [Chytriomyces sp. MP71]|nr:pyridoxal phosphate-dependent transferase [Chytriomyces sp. MP71]